MQYINQKRIYGPMLLALLAFLGANTLVQQRLIANRAQNLAAEQKTEKAQLKHLPLSFEKNVGQFSIGADFATRAYGYRLYLTPGGALLNIAPQNSHTNALLQFNLRGANPNAQGVGVNPLAKSVNYYRGERQRFTNIPAYEQVQYQNIYAGIDVIYYNNNGKLEYDFVLAPEADPHAIRFAFNGLDSIKITRDGELQLASDIGVIKQAKPVAYQIIAGKKKPVDSRYYLSEMGELSFILGDYDKTQPLVIDPVLSVFSYIGGSDFDSGDSIAQDADGNIYITGTTYSSDLAVTPDAEQLDHAAEADIFVAKLNPEGNAIAYLSYFGGSGIDLAKDIAVDADGNTYITGVTDSTDLSLVNPLQASNSGNFDMFAAKFDAQGFLVFSTYLGGKNNDNGYSIAVADDERVFIAGDTTSPDMPTTAQAFDQSCGSDASCDTDYSQTKATQKSDAYLAVLSLDNFGNYQLSYASYLGGSGNDSALAVSIRSNQLAVLSGETNAADFPVRHGVQTSLHGGFNGGYDAFVVAVNPNLAGDASLVYGSYFGGEGEDSGKDIVVDSQGTVHIAGDTNSSDLITTAHAYQREFKGGDWDVFTASFDVTKTGSQSLLFSSYLGGAGNDNAKAIALDADNRIHIAGKTQSINFPFYHGTQANYAGHGDGFITKFAANGQTVEYSTFLGGSGNDAINGMVVNADDQPIVAGETQSQSFATGYAFQALYAGQADGFVSRLDTTQNNQNGSGSSSSAQKSTGGGGAIDYALFAILLLSLYLRRRQGRIAKVRRTDE